MNTFGRLFRLSIYGESHGPLIGVVIDGVRPGIPIDIHDFKADISRRQAGALGTTTRIESDIPLIKSGIFNNLTTGAPICIEFENSNVQSKDYEQYVTLPRPGHADFTAKIKYNSFNDYRGGGHFSGRLTLCLIAAAVIAKKILGNLKYNTKIIEIAGESDPEIGIQKAIQAQDSVGGIVECRVGGLEPGIGEPFFDSIESVLSHLIFSIPAIKGVEFGSGFASTKMFGSFHNDSISDQLGTTETNNSGGISGGISNSNELIIRVAVKPTSSTPQIQKSINLSNNEMEEFKIMGRHDLCIALRVPVILESVVAIGLCDLFLINKSIYK
ncbi:MAG: chorismate synthase [Saprospiraceae bacterium]